MEQLVELHVYPCAWQADLRNMRVGLLLCQLRGGILAADPQTSWKTEIPTIPPRTKWGWYIINKQDIIIYYYIVHDSIMGQLACKDEN